MDDYIFLIIAIVLSIFGAINQSKKKKAAENLLEEEDLKPRNFFMDQLLGEDFLRETKVKKTTPVKVKTAPASVAFKGSSNIQQIENYKPPRFKSTLPDRLKRETILTVQRQSEDEEIIEEESISYLEDFSLRKAFVYSLIMERKY
jgi:hypothetical protein